MWPRYVAVHSLPTAMVDRIEGLNSGASSVYGSDAVAGFNLLRSMKLAVTNIRVTNNSCGGGGYSQALKDAMAALEVTPGAPGTLNVCAAGNSGVNADFTPMYPAAYDNRGIVSVLASDANDLGASFTNYGLASVDLAAPGVNTYSTEAMGTCSLCDPSGYRTLSGTSMASPHVAGVAAAMLSAHPSLTAAQARDAMAGFGQGPPAVTLDGPPMLTHLVQPVLDGNERVIGQALRRRPGMVAQDGEGHTALHERQEVCVAEQGGAQDQHALDEERHAPSWRHDGTRKQAPAHHQGGPLPHHRIVRPADQRKVEDEDRKKDQVEDDNGHWERRVHGRTPGNSDSTCGTIDSAPCLTAIE